jgi:hypothetical protein
MKRPGWFGWRRVRSVFGWMAVAAALPLMGACNARSLEAVASHPVQVYTNTFKATINRQVDILFMIDNSQSMQPLQDKLLANFPVFMNYLKNIPTGDGTGAVALPDVHIAVVSSDAGPGKYDLPDIHCRYQGDQGLFQTAPRGACTTSPLNPGQTFLAASNNQAQTNYTGDITDAFTCIAALGEGGCGFESQLKSPRWALDPDNVPPGNEGFLRPDAYLAVVLITNEDDCSVQDDSDLIDPSSQTMADRYGPLWSFRCNEYGHLCTDPNNPTGPLKAPVRGVNTNLTGCVSNDTTTGLETHVADEVAFLKGLKADPTQILVAAITGPVTPYNVEMDLRTTAGGVTELQPNTVHSCMENNGEYADPAVRLQQWVEAFGGKGLFLPICRDSFAPALTAIATAIGQALGPQCVAGPIQTNAAGNPICAVNDRYTDTVTGKVIQTPLSACAENGNSAPCWSLGADATQCSTAQAQLLTITRPAGALPSSLDTDVSCSLCTAGEVQSGCP